MDKKLEEMNVEELKSLAYDLIVANQKIQNDLQVINQLIQNKKQEVNTTSVKNGKKEEGTS